MRIPVKKRLVLPPKVEHLEDLIHMAFTGKRYANIDNEMLWRISGQLVEINNMIGMVKLKETIFYHVIYYIQNLFRDVEKDYLHTVITGSPGSGKCLGKDTKILMYNSDIKNVQDIEIGDIIMGYDSTSRKVLSICKGVENMYRIDYPNGFYEINESHILSLVNINKDDEIEDISLQDYLKLSNKNKYMGFRVPVQFPIEEKFTIDPYIFGYVLIKLFVLDTDYLMIELKNDIVESYLDHFGILYHMSLNTFYLDCDYFNDYLDVLKKKCLPEKYRLFKHDILKYILAGINDAIGILDKQDSCICIDNLKLFNQLVDICNIVGIEYTINEKSITYSVNQSESKKTIKHYNIYLLDVFSNIPSFIYKIKYKYPPKSKKIKYPIKVTPLGIGTYYGFELTKPRFLLGDCTVTHNTTVAKIIGEMYKNMGILSPNGTFKIAKREDLVAEYLGQTAIKTKKLLESCLGGVLFIDEVYALGPGIKDNDSFSKEAIDTLNVFLSENKDNFCCIVAGYEDEIEKCFFSVNKGLRRRFQWVHRIEDYTVDELGNMFIKMLNDISWKKDKNLTLTIITEIINQNKTLFDYFGGDIENLITKCKMAHAKRIINIVNPEKHVITRDDLLFAIELMKPNKLLKNDDHYNEFMYI